MIIEDLFEKQHMTKICLQYRPEFLMLLSVIYAAERQSLKNVPQKRYTSFAKALKVPMELLTESGVQESEQEESYEYGLRNIYSMIWMNIKRAEGTQQFT